MARSQSSDCFGDRIPSLNLDGGNKRVEETPQGSGFRPRLSLSLLGRVVNLRLQDKEAKGDEKEMVLQRRLYKE